MTINAVVMLAKHKILIARDKCEYKGNFEDYLFDADKALEYGMDGAEYCTAYDKIESFDKTISSERLEINVKYLTPISR